MIYSLNGQFVAKQKGFIVIEIGGIAFKVFVSLRALQNLPQVGQKIKVFCSLYSRQDSMLELYGFLSEAELYLFEKLNTVGGIGPKTALGLLGVADVNSLIAAINQGKIELLTKAAGIGKKTAERIVMELRDKLEEKFIQGSAAQTLNLMESDLELEETLISLGYSKQQAKAAIAKIDSKITGFKERLKEALKQQKVVGK